MSQSTSIAETMRALGWRIVGTGGGCEAYTLGKGYSAHAETLPLSEQWYQLLTVDDDPSVPTYWDEPVEIGHYCFAGDNEGVSVFKGTLRAYVATCGVTVTAPDRYTPCDECGERPDDCECVAAFAMGCTTCEARHGDGALCTCGQ